MREMLEETEGGARALRVRIQLAGWSPEGARARARRSAPASARPAPPNRSDALPDSARPVQSREGAPALVEKVGGPIQTWHSARGCEAGHPTVRRRSGTRR